MSESKWDFFTLDDFNLKGRTVLVRVDINSPIDPTSGRILDDHRIRRHLETIRDLDKSKVVILAHQSRPGKKDYTTLDTHAVRMSQLLGKRVEYVDGLFESHVRKRIRNMETGEKIMLENARFYAEETYLKGDQDWSRHQNSHIVQKLAPLVDFYVHDAFAAAHRAQPTLIGFSELVPTVAGRVMQKELEDMGKAFDESLSPKVAFLGGMKVDDSIEVAEHMLKSGSIDKVLTGGVVGQVFLLAQGYDLGDESIGFLEEEVPEYEELAEKAGELLEEWGGKIKVPRDVALNVDGSRDDVRVEELPSEGEIQDIGLDTVIDYTEEIDRAELVVVNGPAGVFEVDEFSIGTTELFREIAHADTFSIIGGGHSVAVVEKLDIDEEIDHISTGGGSCINFLAGRELVGVEALERSKKIFRKGPFQKK